MHLEWSKDFKDVNIEPKFRPWEVGQKLHKNSGGTNRQTYGSESYWHMSVWKIGDLEVHFFDRDGELFFSESYTLLLYWNYYAWASLCKLNITDLLQ